jgi:serine/threonine protein kinase
MDSQGQHPSIRGKEIFLEALDIQHPEERAAYLDRACAGDHQLRESVEDLLQLHKQDDFINSSGAENDSFEIPGEKVGDTIGRYKLVREIGEGGWGIVYLAEQQTPFRRSVALKIVKLGMNTRLVVRRFNSERQALALLNHTGIAKVFDAGATNSGRPYFAMELIENGKRIIDYANEKRLTIPQRLQLFLKVCKAVAHAHKMGIIHRDIKSSNILVAEEDGLPVPKVIDFGIAKAINQESNDFLTTTTATGQFIGTLTCMSPEQVTPGQKVDTSTDIYAMGCLLYEMLVGCQPLDLGDLPYEKQVSLIQNVEPILPSQQLSIRKAQNIDDIAKLRNTASTVLLESVRGELDRIVMKCLEKNRGQRYETVEHLCADVEHCIHRINQRFEEQPPKSDRAHNSTFLTPLKVLALNYWQMDTLWQSDTERVEIQNQGWYKSVVGIGGKMFLLLFIWQPLHFFYQGAYLAASIVFLILTIMTYVSYRLRQRR